MVQRLVWTVVLSSMDPCCDLDAFLYILGFPYWIYQFQVLCCAVLSALLQVAWSWRYSQGKVSAHDTTKRTVT